MIVKGGKKMMNRKAVSAVVATVLIILITVAAVAIIWTTIIPMVRKNIDSGTLCLDAQSDISIVASGGYTCYIANADGTYGVKVQVSHGSKNFDLNDIMVGVKVGGDTTTKGLLDTTTDGWGATGDLPGQNEEKTYTIDDVGSVQPTGVEISAVVKVGETEEACDPSGSVDTLTECSTA